MRRHPFIVLEGIDGSGKSTTAKRVAELLRARLYKTPPPAIAELKKYYDNCASIEARYCYYLSGVLIASAEIELMLNESPVVCDRYLHTTIAYHQAIGYEPKWLDFSQLGLLQPDYVFCLTASEETIIHRLKTRDNNSSPYSRANDAALMQQVAQSLASFATEVIDTTELTEDDVAFIIYNKVCNK